MRTVLLVLLFTSMTFGCFQREQYSKEYQPLRFDGDGLVVVLELYTKDHFDRVEKVLLFYGTKHARTADTRIEFPTRVDTEFIWNITNKAESPDWLKSNLKRQVKAK